MPTELPIAPLDRLTISAWAIVHLQEIGEISEGTARKLMNSPDVVSYRLTKEKVVGQMLGLIAHDCTQLAAANVKKAKGE